MKFIILQIFLSFLYVFEVSVSPQLHIPFIVLTVIYLGAMAETFSLYKVSKAISKRLRKNKTT